MYKCIVSCRLVCISVLYCIICVLLCSSPVCISVLSSCRLWLAL